MRLHLALILTLLAGVPPLHAQGVQPFASAAVAMPANADEARVWGQGDEFDEMLRKSGRLLNDPQLTAYVQHVMDRLFPEFKGRLKVRIVNSPQLNAFALPNGSIYINQGLLARFENESQLATVLAHEAIHVINRHGHQQMQNVKSSSAFGAIFSVIGIPIVGLVSTVLAASSIVGYSRDLETEADNQAYPRVVAAGYDARETPKVFSHLSAELKAADIKEPFFFSSHPKLQERYENFLRLSEKSAAPDTPLPDEYAATVAQLRVATLESELSMGRYKQVLMVLSDAERLKNYPPYAHYYLGEAYRRRSQQGDDERLEQAYRAAIEAAPDFAPSYRALGIHFLKKGSYDEAQKHLEQYLALSQNSDDRKYVEGYLELARKQGQP